METSPRSRRSSPTSMTPVRTWSCMAAISLAAGHVSGKSSIGFGTSAGLECSAMPTRCCGIRIWSRQHLSAPAYQRMRDIVFQHIAVTVDSIGPERLAWLRALPVRWSANDLTVVHAGPDDVWRSPSAKASDEELETTYGTLGSPCVVYGHIHHPFVRRLPLLTVANSGSVSLSYDGDPRAAYALVDDGEVTIRRVEYRHRARGARPRRRPLPVRVVDRCDAPQRHIRAASCRRRSVKAG